MNRLPRGLALLLGLTLLGMPRPAPAQSSDQALLKTIAEAWQRREEATRSVEIVWEETETIPRDALTNHPGLNRQAELGEAGKAPFPPADTTLVRKGRVILEGNRIRYEGEREHLGDKADIWHDTYISAYDGRQTKTFWRTSRAEWPSAQIWNEPFFHDRPMLEIAPILLSLRPANAVLGKVPLQACRVSSARPAGGANADCVILVEDTGPGSRVEYWLQPAADYAIVRKTTKSGGKVRTDHEIQYNHDAASGVWLPSDWKITWFKRWDDKIHFTLHGRVTSCKLNVASAANAFDLEFPSDALVSIMGDTPETTIDVVEHRRSWLEWGAIAGGLVAACLLVIGLVRKSIRRRSSLATIRGLALLLGLSLLGLPRPAPAQSFDQALLETIAEAWRRREEATRSVEIVWEETETIPQGALTNHPALIASGQPPDKGPRPPTDVTLKHDKSAVLSGDQIRYEGTKDRLGANSEVWKDHYLSTYDGLQSKNLWYPRNDAPVGQVWNEPFYHDRSSFDVVPILLSFRPGNGVLGKVDLQKCRVSRARPGGANSDCVILVEDIAPGSRVEYWLRPEADFALVHRTAISNGVVETDDDFQYARDPASGVWLPVGWRITWFKLWDGKIYFTLRGRVTACKLNAEPATGTFDIEFPGDALVSIMGATPETTIDLVEHKRPWLEWGAIIGGLVAAGLLAAGLLRRRNRWRPRRVTLRGTLAIAMGLSMLVAAEPAHGQNADQSLLDTIAEAWRRREEATRLVEITWVDVKTIPRGALTKHPALSNQSQAASKEPAKSEAPIPPNDVALERRGQIVLNGDLIRCDLTRQRLGEHSQVWQDRFVSTFDGRQSKTLWYNPRAEAPRGQIWPEPFFHGRSSLEIAPVLMSLRAGNAALGKVDLQRCRVLAARPRGPQAEFVVLVEDLAPGSRIEYWLQPEADYAIVRRMATTSGKLHTDDAIRYLRDAASGVWLPSAWTITWFKAWDGQIDFTVAGRVTRCKLDSRVPADTFDIVFPSDALLSVMGNTPETTIDLVGHRTSWLGRGAIGSGLVIACLLGAGLLRKFVRGRSTAAALRGLLAIQLGLAMLSVARPARAQSSDPALLETIAEAWRRREEATSSIEIAWQETEVIPRDALTNHPALDRQARLGEAGKAPYPAADTILKRWGEATIKGDLIRYEGTRQRLGEKADVWEDRYLSTFDGKQSKTLWYNPRAASPRGQIWTASSYRNRSSLEVAPILLSLRLGNAMLGAFELHNCRVARAKPGGAYADCVILVEDISPGSRVEYWLRPEADYAVVRRTATSGGKLETDEEVRYARDAASGAWLPNAWTITWFKLWDGKIYFTLRGQVTRCILNVDPPPGIFDLTFPREANVSLMGDTPETTIDLVEHQRSWFGWGVLVVGLATTCLLAARFLRRHVRSPK